jgi:hypothetical protein
MVRTTVAPATVKIGGVVTLSGKTGPPAVLAGFR